MRKRNPMWNSWYMFKEKTKVWCKFHFITKHNDNSPSQFTSNPCLGVGIKLML